MNPEPELWFQKPRNLYCYLCGEKFSYFDKKIYARISYRNTAEKLFCKDCYSWVKVAIMRRKNETKNNN